MLARLAIRNKLYVIVGLLLVAVAILLVSSMQGTYAYRGLVKSISRRSTELPLTTDLARHVSELQITLGDMRNVRDYSLNVGERSAITPMLRTDFRNRLTAIHATVDAYREQLRNNELADAQIGDNDREWETIEKIEQSLRRIEEFSNDEDWILGELRVDQLSKEFQHLQDYTSELPTFLQRRMHEFADEVRVQYRLWIILQYASGTAAVILLVVLARLFYVWIFRPLGTLIAGSRRVAAGDFQHRIELQSHDEMGELAQAMNHMTARFQEIRADLDNQVRIRTQQAVRSEQLASVGFLAAGVAHEINNPLASIAMCSESLEARVQGIIEADADRPDDQRSGEIAVLRDYLQMIQEEAFRCKQITERLLDFSRLGDVEKHNTDLEELIRGVIDMVGHLGKYKHKNIEFRAHEGVVARVNPPEIKQVMLNLITNALESLDAGGTVWIDLRARDGMADIAVSDNGCGMTEEVLENLFEPFFTRRREGQGTGLGLSITFRIVAGHGGGIEAHSDGPGKGSRLRVTLPLARSERAGEANLENRSSIKHKEVHHRYQTA